MRVCDRKNISRKVKLFVCAMPQGYEKSVPKDVVISEILGANAWFVQMPATMEQIREEVEDCFDAHIKKHTI